MRKRESVHNPVIWKNRKRVRESEEIIVNKEIKMAALFLTMGIFAANSGKLGSGSSLAYAADKPSTVVIDGKNMEVPLSWDKESIRELIKKSKRAESSGAASSGGKTAEIDVSGTPDVSGGVGWIASGDSWIFYNDDGTALRDGVTPDGYYVDVDGRWRSRTITLLDETFVLPDKFIGSKNVGSMLSDLEPLERLNKRIRALIGAQRAFYVYDDSIRYVAVNSGRESFLMGLYKDPSNGGWQLKLSTKFNKSTERSAEETCDYMVLRFLLGKVSHVPERVSDAIYESWQGDNSYGITSQTPKAVGDTAITYSVEEGAGVYKLLNGINYRQ